MAGPSISQTEKPIDENKPTAIIYSISDLGEYIVEIRFNNQQYYIGKEKAPDRFANLGQAKEAARAHNAEQGFLALSKTYQEVEADNKSQTDTMEAESSQRFDYLPLTF